MRRTAAHSLRIIARQGIAHKRSLVLPRPPLSCRCFHASASFARPSRPSYTISTLDLQTYQRASDLAMESLSDFLEELVEQQPPESECEVEYSSGVLTLSLGSKGTYVINKQPPNAQIWLSSPTSGPKRYDYDAQHGEWFYARDHSLMRELLSTELSAALNEDIVVTLGKDAT